MASTCCVKGFTWNGTPSGRTDKIAGFDAYVAGDNSRAAVLLVHDIYGWKANNARLLADHYAREAGVTVFVPDFFRGGQVVRASRPDLSDGDFLKQVIFPFLGDHPRAERDADIFAVARALKRDLGFTKVGAIGFCWGGWAVFRLGASADKHPADTPGATPIEGPLVDAIAAAHPSLLTTADIDDVRAPTLVLAPEIDALYSPALKQHTLDALQANGVALDYLHFPGVEHGVLVRADESQPLAAAALVRAKHATVSFFQLHL